jgi:hypothetical protein
VSHWDSANNLQASCLAKDQEPQTVNQSTQYAAVVEVEGLLGFSRPDEVIPDTEGRGLKRAKTHASDAGYARMLEYRSCRIRDWSAPGQPRPNIRKMGFESIDLSPLTALQELLAQIRAAGEITPQQGRQLRRHLTGGVFPLSDGKCLKMLQIAPEGLIMRKGGPNGLKTDPDVTMGEMNGHDVAVSVHGDQDVRGTPLKQIMRGFAPQLFRHQTPDGSNTLSPLVLVNLWIPLQQITRPLALMDRRTLNAREHQLRYALPTDAFLDRREDMRVNDIWSFLHDDAQLWYFHSAMGHDKAYIFDTLGEPHGAFILPGEEVAEQYYLQLQRLREQLAAGIHPLPPVLSSAPVPSSTTAALRAAIERMAALLAGFPHATAGGQAVAEWQLQAKDAMEAVVRKSLEMRVVALLLPDVWPFNRGRLSV